MVQVESAQHIASHADALFPMTVQLWKHMRPLEQVASERQSMVSWQQLPTMHWLHGVPPGSSVQLPASTAMPQCPLAHTSPTQHSVELVQFEPVGRHMPVPQTLFSQAMLQHSLGELHGKPSSLHWFMPQTPLSQTALQQSPGWEQAKPSGVHIPKPPVCGLQTVSQQSLSVEQAAPSGAHAVPHSPCGLQIPVQHSESAVHGRASGMQVTHVPPNAASWQALEQH